VRPGPPAAGGSAGRSAAGSALEEGLARAEARASRAEAQLRAVAQELELRISQQESDSAREIVAELSALAQSADSRIRDLESECALLRASHGGGLEGAPAAGAEAAAAPGPPRLGAAVSGRSAGGAAPAASGSSGVALVRQLERQLAEALASTQGQVAQALAAVRQAEYNFDLVRIRSEFLETQAALGLGVGVLGASFGLWTLWKVAVKRAR